jgi:hypothetical protein
VNEDASFDEKTVAFFTCDPNMVLMPMLMTVMMPHVINTLCSTTNSAILLVSVLQPSQPPLKHRAEEEEQLLKFWRNNNQNCTQMFSSDIRPKIPKTARQTNLLNNSQLNLISVWVSVYDTLHSSTPFPTNYYPPPPKYYPIKDDDESLFVFAPTTMPYMNHLNWVRRAATANQPASFMRCPFVAH